MYFWPANSLGFAKPFSDLATVTGPQNFASTKKALSAAVSCWTWAMTEQRYLLVSVEQTSSSPWRSNIFMDIQRYSISVGICWISVGICWISIGICWYLLNILSWPFVKLFLSQENDGPHENDQRNHRHLQKVQVVLLPSRLRSTAEQPSWSYMRNDPFQSFSHDQCHLVSSPE